MGVKIKLLKQNHLVTHHMESKLVFCADREETFHS